MSESKHCPSCKQDKPVADFPKSKHTKDGHDVYCKPCRNVASKKYYRENYSKRVGKIREYSQSHPEVFIARNGKTRSRDVFGLTEHFTSQEFKELCERFGNVCVWCKKKKVLTADHIVPLTKGGRNTIDNIQPLCRSCNSKKRTKATDYRHTVIPLFLQRLFKVA